jgi:hypothetical protein
MSQPGPRSTLTRRRTPRPTADPEGTARRPLALRFGGEVRPGGADPASRLLLSLGYSFATPVAATDDEDDDADGTAFTIGVSYRLNDLIAVGAGRWFTGADQDWYLSLAGDLGAIPFLRELFARTPDR